MSFKVPEQYRVTGGRWASTKEDGNNGAFIIPARSHGRQARPFTLHVVASDGMSWEHVSVSTNVRCPTWEEMCFVKSLFWDDDDCVVQFHPSRAEYINMHPHCLHMWRPCDGNMQIPKPPSILVGF